MSAKGFSFLGSELEGSHLTSERQQAHESSGLPSNGAPAGLAESPKGGSLGHAECSLSQN